jgi:hypothetical protein
LGARVGSISATILCPICLKLRQLRARPELASIVRRFTGARQRAFRGDLIVFDQHPKTPGKKNHAVDSLLFAASIENVKESSIPDP